MIRHKDKDLVAVTGSDGRLYLLDGASLGGADHKTPLVVTGKYTSGAATTGLATWEADGTRWIATTASGAPPAAARLTANGPVVTGGGRHVQGVRARRDARRSSRAGCLAT